MNLEFKLTDAPTLEPLLRALCSDTNFQRFMEIVEARCTGLAVKSCAFPDDTYRMWAAGRVQEMSDILVMYEQCKRPKQPAMPYIGVPPDGF